MSRTLKDRPHWVRRNDPKTEKYASHDHKIVCREKIGEEPVMRRVPSKDGWHWYDEVWYTRPLFKRWVENVPCTLDVPETGPSSWWGSRRSSSNEDKRQDKHCHWNLEYYPGGPSGKEYKKLTNSAIRSKVRTQLQLALINDVDWDEVDINDGSKYASRGWWDW